MDSEFLHYVTGEEVHAGDRVQYRGDFGTVIFVSNGETEECSPGYNDHAGTQRGIVLRDDDGNTRFVGDPDDLLAFLDRG